MRSNKELSNEEFLISQHLKRALSSLYDGNYHNAEMNLHTALQRLMPLNTSKTVGI
jgi:hypothetical protein